MWLTGGSNRVLVSPQGGSVLLWQHRERFILGPARTVKVGGELKLRGETHWCYPNFGSVGAEKYQLPKHGWLRDTVLATRAHGTVHAHFARLPGFDLPVEVITSIDQDDTLRASLSVTNRGEERVPILPALHPYFATPEDGLAVVVGVGMVARVYPGQEPWQVSDRARVLERTGDVHVILYGVGIVDLSLPDNCTHVVVWSDRPECYVCVEPVFGKPGTFGDPDGRWLEQDETAECDAVFHFTPA